MKTLLTRMKTLVENNSGSGQTLSYVKGVEVIYPDLNQTVLSIGSFPKVNLVAVSTTEEWVSTQRKQATHVVLAYLTMIYLQRESYFLGDASRPGGHGKGIIDFIDDFSTVFRGHRLSVNDEVYLDKPLDIVNINYAVEEYAENARLGVARITMQCTRLFNQTSLPGNV